MLSRVRVQFHDERPGAVVPQHRGRGVRCCRADADARHAVQRLGEGRQRPGDVVLHEVAADAAAAVLRDNCAGSFIVELDSDPREHPSSWSHLKGFRRMGAALC